MSRPKGKEAELYWSYARMGYDQDSLATIARDVGIDPDNPPYSMISVNEIPDKEEVELLVCTHDDSWMKIRAYVEGNQITYLPYRSYGQAFMPDGLSAIRQQVLDSGMVNPPIQESLNSCSGKFFRIYKLPDLSEWDRAKAREWLELQNTPGTSVSLLHERAAENNYSGSGWVPVWIRPGRDLFKQGRVSVAHIEQMAEEAEQRRLLGHDTDDGRSILLDDLPAYRKPKRGWLSRIFGHRD